jgi:hypothetical protein
MSGDGTAHADPHVRAALNDMARSWERLAIQAAQFSSQAQLDFFFATVPHQLNSFGANGPR